MSFIGNFVRAAIIGVALTAVAPAAFAQEITASHLAVALDVVKSAKASRGFDSVLPLLAEQVENKLIRVRPDLNKEIVSAVEDAALKLSARRSDLDNDIARIWAKAFSEEELNTIAAFYKSPAGQKFADVGAQVVAESYQAVGHWSDRVGEELLQKSKDGLKAQGITF
jgi:uncharacterized protein